MLEIIIENAKLITMLFSLFGLFFGANMLFGLYLNVSIKAEKFEAKRFWDGVKRGLILFTGIVLLVMGVSTIGTIVNSVDFINVSSEVIDGISVSVIGTIIVLSTVDYATQSIDKFKNIMNKGGK